MAVAVHQAMAYGTADVCVETAAALDPEGDIKESPLQRLMECVRIQTLEPIHKYVAVVVNYTERAIKIAHEEGNFELERALRRQLDQLNTTLDTLHAFDECLILHDLLVRAENSLCYDVLYVMTSAWFGVR